MPRDGVLVVEVARGHATIGIEMVRLPRQQQFRGVPRQPIDKSGRRGVDVPVSVSFAVNGGGVRREESLSVH